MYDVILEVPTIEHEVLANQFKTEFFDNSERIINGSALLDEMEYREWLNNIQRNNNRSTVSKDWVVASTFFAVRKDDKKIIGIIDVRHSLGNRILAAYGGHIGYSVRPSERKNGYAKQMLMLALEYAKLINLTKVMIGCFSDNIASIKTIISCGGVFSESKPYVNGKQMNVYWIDIA